MTPTTYLESLRIARAHSMRVARNARDLIPSIRDHHVRLNVRDARDINHALVRALQESRS